IQMGSFAELLLAAPWRRRAWIGMLLAAIGLATFWAVTIAGKDIVSHFLASRGVEAVEVEARSKFAYGFIQATGGGVGLFAFGPIAAWLGRRRAFALFHLLGLAIVPVVCFLPQAYWQLLLLLPLYGFFTMGMHSGYAIYFPELFPTHLRATGSSFCFNGGRLAAAPVLVYSGQLKALAGPDVRYAICGLALLYLVGFALIWLLPETRGRELIE
ncbi:MAG: MFS transporter, partial [Planctomycetota bacterium]